MSITKIVITGGPCAGKTSGIARIQSFFAKKGYCILVISEAATELIEGGISSQTLNSNFDYQLCQLKLQIAKEEIYETAARIIPAEKILIVCDRGLLDGKAYMSDTAFSDLCKNTQLSEAKIHDRYDAVFHMTTAAKGATNFYTTANNSARTETVEEAIAIDDRLISIWSGHPYFKIINSSTDFIYKTNHLIAEIASFLGETNPY